MSPSKSRKAGFLGFSASNAADSTGNKCSLIFSLTSSFPRRLAIRVDSPSPAAQTEPRSSSPLCAPTDLLEFQFSPVYLAHSNSASNRAKFQVPAVSPRRATGSVDPSLLADRTEPPFNPPVRAPARLDDFQSSPVDSTRSISSSARAVFGVSSAILPGDSLRSQSGISSRTLRAVLRSATTSVGKL